MRMLWAAIAGGLFGLGLIVSGMTNTRKVLGWLDFFGDWDPTLAFVMGGAILPMAAAWAFARRRRPVLGGRFPEANTSGPDRALALGAVLFGMGWGLVGLCPGPALASLSFGGWQGLVFLIAMAAGMYLAPPIKRRLTKPA
ncbi:hypothetical protein IV417_14775 [Alphaproteobacteria bacterium KMM 3653]|uniref:YeeE/YedE family protein n=1 Tax=Harenicola maris TaxID=2841044 RepID=A0AAP2CSX2_9RHOB|nr:hypothetical protein [Harenicola maris]